MSPTTPDFQAFAAEDQARIDALPGLSVAQRHWLARTYTTWLQILWSEGTKQRSMAGVPEVSIESLPGTDVRRRVVLTWAYGGGKGKPFGSLWIDLSGDDPAVMYCFHGFGYGTEAKIVIPTEDPPRLR